MENDFSALENMIYGGRGIIVGMTPEGNTFIGYSLTGRSPSSQARRLLFDDNTMTIMTDVTDPVELQKGSPALLLYPAIVGINNTLIASNGAQTKLLYSAIKNNSQPIPEMILEEAFEKPIFEYDSKNSRWIDITTYEPDPPNNTPRISAVVCGDKAAFHIVKYNKKSKDESIFKIDLNPGYGSLITTYNGGNENPLISFQNSPLTINVGGNNKDMITQEIFKAISHGDEPGKNFAVASAVMITYKNKYEENIADRSICNRF